MRLLERNIASIGQRLVVLAPPQASIPSSFLNVSTDHARHAELVREMQRLRGSVYLHDGAVQVHQLSPDGRHHTPEDDRSWHLLMLNRHGRVSSCAWYLEHEPSVSLNSLRVRNCPLNQRPGFKERLRAAIERELERARAEGLRYAEVGGWAVSRESRCKAEGLLLAFAAYSLGRRLGGALGLTTATVRHSSSTILRRLGGSSLEVDGETVPGYYDEKYRCDMELLRFDSRVPTSRYNGLIERLKDQLTNVAVVAPASAAGNMFAELAASA